jgi:hypothetical protein
MQIRDLLNTVNTKYVKEEIQEGDIFELELDDLIIETVVVGMRADGPIIALDETALSYVRLEENDHPWYRGKTKVPTPRFFNGELYVENTPQGVLLHGVQLEGGYSDQGGDTGSGHFDFTSNISTGKIVEIDASETAGDRDQYYRDDDAIQDIVQEVVEDFKSSYGTTWDEIYDEIEGGITIDEAKYHGRTVPLGKPMQGDVKKSKVYVKDPVTGNVKKVNFGDKKLSIKKHLPGHRKSFRARHHCKNPGPRTKARYWSCRAW